MGALRTALDRIARLASARRSAIASVLALGLSLSGCTDPEGPLCATSDAPSSKRIIVSTQLRFVVPTAGVSDGFDLDGRVSDSSDALSCGRTDLVDPESNPGVDNQFAVLWGLLLSVVGDAVEGLIQGVINDGTLLLMFQIDGIDDPTDDGCVNVHIFQGAGRPDLGTNGFIAPSQTFDVEADTPYTVTRGRIEDGVLYAGPFEAIVPIAIFQVVADLALHDAQLRATFAEDGSMLATVAGGVENAQIMDVAVMAAENDGTAQGILPLLPGILSNNADLGYVEAADECSQLSTVMTFAGEPAYLYEDAIDPTR